jgi:hypothetical protein
LFCRITASWAEKYGYDSAEDFVKNAQKKFSLVETGVMDQPNCRLLMLNVCFDWREIWILGLMLTFLIGR